MRIATLILAAAGLAMAPLADGPGLPKLSFTAAELYKPLSFIHAPSGYAHGQAGMVNGYLFVPFFRDATPSNGGFDFYDISNPRSPVRVFRQAGGSTGLREPHAYGSTDGGDTFVLQATDGLEFWSFANPTAPVRLSHLTLPNITQDAGYGGLWWACWQAPLVYCGGTDQGLYIVDAANPASPRFVKRIPINQLGGFKVGSTFAIGNLLVLASTADSDSSAPTSGGKFTTMDISDPLNPVLIRVFNSVNGYSSLVNGDRILVGGVNNMFHVLDIRDPANLALGGSVDLGSPGGYVSFQDGFAHSGYGTKSVKVDVRSGAPVLAASGSSGIADKDDNFAIPLGNMIFASNDHPAGSALLVHQAAPDNNGPAVNMVVPKNGATGQASTSRVGLTFTDEIDSRTLGPSSVIVRPLGGAAVAGRYSYQQNIVNFYPDAPLAAGTTYEIVVPAGGVKDWSGNAVTTAFRSTFTTAGGAGSKSALLVVGNTTLSAGDAALRTRLENLGYAVTTRDDNGASAAAAGKSVIVISESVETATGIGEVFANVAVPLVTSESGIYNALKLTGPTLDTDYGTVAGQTQVTIVDPSHPLAAGLSGTVTVGSAAQPLDWGVPSASAKRVATIAGQAGRAAIFGYDSGAGMVGMNAPARRVAWFAEDAGAAVLTAAGGALFDAAVTWAAGTTSTPPPANAPPTVSLTSPAPGAAFGAPATITLTASAGDVDGSVAKVEFFAGGTLLGTELTAPYNVTWTNVAAGSYALTARATDDDGATTTSAPVNVTVTGPGGSGQAVERFVLVDGSGTAIFDPLVDGAVLNAGTLPPGTVIWALTSPDPVGSVRFSLDGTASYRMENAGPYSLGEGWKTMPGAHSTTATPYTQPSGGGVAGASRTLTFSVLNDPTSPSVNGGGGAAPGPAASGRDNDNGDGLCGATGLEALLALFLRRRRRGGIPDVK